MSEVKIHISALEAENKRLRNEAAKALSMEMANERNFDYAVNLIKELHGAWIDPGITVYAAFEETQTLRWRVERFLKVATPTDPATYEMRMAVVKRLLEGKK